jgi:hypothetical protein
MTIQDQIQALEVSKTGNFIEDMNIAEEIRMLEKQLKGEEPVEQSCSMDNDDFGCEMCGS